MKTYRLAALLLIAPAIGFSEPSLQLTKDSTWTIVVDADAIAGERYAAQEFQTYIREALGVEWPIAATPAKATENVFIGPSQSMAESSAKVTIAELGEEGLRIRIEPENITIAGGRPRGTLYGVYEFLERYLGVRFLTFDDTYVPQCASVSLPCETYQFVPAFSFRYHCMRENAISERFAAKMRMNTVVRDEKYGGSTKQHLISHTFYRQLPIEKYGESHPEYYALIDGKRMNSGHQWEPCVTHPEVIDIITQSVLDQLDADPSLQNVSVSQNDDDRYCRCERCEAINKREGTPMGAHLMLVNEVARRVEERYPHVKVGTLAYWYTRKPPKTIKPRRNVQIQLCDIECCTLYPLENPNIAENVSFYNDLKGWGKICDDIWIWHYNTNFNNYDLPFPNLRTIAPNIRFFLRNNAKGIFMQGPCNGLTSSFSDLRNYVTAKCLWHPELDGWELVEEFCRLHYRNAAEPILAYLKRFHDNAETKGVRPTCFASAQEVGLTPEVVDWSFNYFEEAMRRADNEIIRAHVEKASIGNYRAAIETCGVLEYQDGGYRMVLPERYRDAIDRYINLCMRHNMTWATERMRAEDYFKIIRTAANSQIPAVRLENDIWRLTVFPEENGQAVEMIHKPTGRNLLEGLTAGGFGNMLWRGTFKENGLKGYNAGSPKAFTAESRENSIVLTKTLEDGSILTRVLAFGSDDPAVLHCETRLEYKGTKAKAFQFFVHPELNAWTHTTDAAVLSAYVLGEDGWHLFNQGWSKGTGPNVKLLTKHQAGSVAFFNHDESAGVLLRYDPAQMDHPSFFWNASLSQVNLELYGKTVTLNPGDSYTHQYDFTFLTAPPQ